MIEDKLVQEWSESYRKNFIDNIFKTFEQFDVKKHEIRKIIIVGSRIYEEFRPFHKNSDINCIVFINDHKFPIKNVTLPIKKRYMNIPLEIKVYPFSRFEEIVSNYINLNLPYYDIVKKKYYPGNRNDLVDYLRNIKGRIRLSRPCFICDREKAEMIMNYTFRDLRNNAIQKIQVDVCEDCYNKFFGRKLIKLVQIFKEELNNVESK